MPILNVSHVKKYYGKGDTLVKAVDDISLSVAAGEFVAITGSSGSGKSTLLHLIGGVDTLTEGSICINDIELTALNKTQLAIFRRRHIGLIYQFYNLIPVLNVKENIELPLRLDKKRPNKEKVEELMERLQLSDRERHLPSQLSGGQQQRVSIARALLAQPALLLADEPTGNLDKKNSQEVMRYLKQIHEDGQTILLVTHDMDIAAYADRILYLEDGRIIKDEVR